MPEQMTDERRRSFLSAGTRTGIVATARADGHPHAVPVCFVLDGDDVLFLTNAGTVKGRNMARDPRACLVVDDPAPPYAFVRVDGAVTTTTDADAIRPAARAIAERYEMGEGADGFVEYALHGLGTLVRLTPTSVAALDRVGE
jgi:PPOX class probable F420-dependent enzyme